MPTPFMHMALVQRLMADSALPGEIRAALEESWGAFLLGSIAPDARVSGGLERSSTHFFDYQPVLPTPPARVMLHTFPTLRRPALASAAQIAFVAGYAGHLAMDEIWCVAMLFPKFHGGWGTGYLRHLLLHMLLAYMDDRDRATLPHSDYPALSAARPAGWLPFITDTDLISWRDIVAPQLAPDAQSRTFEILGKRIGMDQQQVRAYLDDSAAMRPLWENIPPEAVAEIEQAMYQHVLSTLIGYFADNL